MSFSVSRFFARGSFRVSGTWFNLQFVWLRKEAVDDEPEQYGRIGWTMGFAFGTYDKLAKLRGRNVVAWCNIGPVDESGVLKWGGSKRVWLEVPVPCRSSSLFPMQLFRRRTGSDDAWEPLDAEPKS